MLLRLFLPVILAAMSTICSAETIDPFDIPALESDKTLYRRIYIKSGISANDSDFWDFGGSLDINQYWRSDFTYGETRYKLLDNIIVTNDYQLSAIFKATDIFSLGLQYEFEGSDNQIEVHSKSTPIIVSFNSFTLGITPVKRDIRLYTNIVLPRKRNDYIDIESDGYRLDATLDTSSLTSLTAGYEGYNYDTDVTKLASSPLAILLLKPAALDRSSGFIDYNRYIGASLLLDTMELGLEFERTHSAIDGSNADQISISSLYILNRHWDLGLELTRSETPLTIADGASMSLHYNW